MPAPSIRAAPLNLLTFSPCQNHTNRQAIHQFLQIWAITIFCCHEHQFQRSQSDIRSEQPTDQFEAKFVQFIIYRFHSQSGTETGVSRIAAQTTVMAAPCIFFSATHRNRFLHGFASMLLCYLFLDFELRLELLERTDTIRPGIEVQRA